MTTIYLVQGRVPRSPKVQIVTTGGLQWNKVIDVMEPESQRTSAVQAQHAVTVTLCHFNLCCCRLMEKRHIGTIHRCPAHNNTQLLVQTETIRIVQLHLAVYAAVGLVYFDDNTFLVVAVL